MLNEIAQILDQYGWVTLALVVSATLLIRYLLTKWAVWTERDKKTIDEKENLHLIELTNHQFFSNSDFLINNEIPTLKFTFSAKKELPVKQKVFRQLLIFYFRSVRVSSAEIVEADVDGITTSQWAALVNAKLTEAQERFEKWAEEDGIPDIIVKKFTSWRSSTEQTMRSYVVNLAFSTVYITNSARSNTFLYLMNLLMVTTLADAERSAMDINGETKGLMYKNELIE